MRKICTHEELKAALDYDPATGVFIRVRNKKKAGTISHGYVSIAIGSRYYLAHRLAWFYVHGVWPPNDVDHINGDKSDNRIANLRQATRSQNMQNSRKPKTNSSGAKGVHFDKANGRFMAYLQVEKKFVNLGRFDTFEQAKAARVNAVKAIFGAFANEAEVASSPQADARDQQVEPSGHLDSTVSGYPTHGLQHKTPI